MTTDFSKTPLVLRYVYAILAVIAIAVLTVFVSLYVAQQHELETRDRIQFVHLEAVAEAGELARETRELREQVLDRLALRDSERAGAAGIKNLQLGFGGILQSMRSRLSQLSMLEAQSDDEIFALSLKRLADRLYRIDRSLRALELSPDIVTSIDVLSSTIEQHNRLHQIAADRELVALADRQRERPRFLALLFVCLGLGALATLYLLASLRASLRRQEAAERALTESQERLQHIQKRDSLGRLVGGIAHDFNNWLTVILGHVGLLRDAAGGNDRIQTGLDEIEQAGKSATALTRQLLSFSRQQKFEPRIIDLNELIRGMEEMLGRILDKRIELRFRYASDLYDVELDPDQMQQVILNLINNARDAMPDGGELWVKTEKVVVGEADIEITGIPEGKYAKFSVSDTGIGMDEATKERAFEPLFTTKEKGHGTGLGLSTAHGIVTASNGHVLLESQEGAGSTVSVYLPHAERDQSMVPDSAKKMAAQSGFETVLVVEDNEQVRRFVETGLTSLGYGVLAASGGAAGLEMCRNESAGIDVIVSDIVMPAISGPKFMEAAQKYRPDAVPIYMSAYSKEEVLPFRRHSLEAEIPIIAKPFEIEALSRLIREQLDRTTEA